MNIDIHPEFVDRISRINWFSSLFSDDAVQGVRVSHRYISSWSDVEQFHRQMEWGWATNEAANALSFHIGSNFYHLFQTTWNEFNCEIDEFFDELLEPMMKELASRGKSDREYSTMIRWNIAHAIMEDIYRDTNPPLFFSSELLTFYEAGRLPCGWMGEQWPTGRLIVA